MTQADAREPLSQPVTIPAEAYVSPDYARAEQGRLWRKTWLAAARLEDIPDIGNYVTFDIGDDSVILVRKDADTIAAYHNACPHRGRRLIDTPPGARNARGTKTNMICGFHGWTFNLAGQCTYVPHRDNWQGTLTDERTALGPVRVDTWGARRRSGSTCAARSTFPPRRCARPRNCSTIRISTRSVFLKRSRRTMARCAFPVCRHGFRAPPAMSPVPPRRAASIPGRCWTNMD